MSGIPFNFRYLFSMKPLLSMALALCVCAGCHTPDSEEDRKSSVLRSLRPIHTISGDQGWHLEERMEHYGVPGVSIAVVANGMVEWSGNFGVKDRISLEEVTESTLFQAASISKPVTALGTLQLAKSRQWDIRADVNSLLTSWQVEENVHTKEAAVTIAGLLSHTAGISIHGFRGYNIGEEVPSLIQVLNSSGPANSWVVRPILVPGEQFRYSGGGYCILQQLLMDQTLQSFPSLMQEVVLEPLGMTSSYFLQPLPDTLLNRAATGYLPSGRMVEGRRHTYPELAAAGLWTTAADLATFGIALQKSYQGHPIPSFEDRLSELMLSPEHENVGLGIFLNDYKGEPYFQHGGWNEGFSSQLTFHRDRGYGVVVMTNANQPEFIEEVIRGVAEVYGWHAYLPPTHRALKYTAEDAQSIAGRYRYSDDQIVQIYEESDSLFLQYLNEQRQELIKIDHNLFARRHRRSYVMVDVDSVGIRHLIFKQEPSDTATYDYPLMTLDERVPFEWILEDNYEAARKAYFTLEKKHPQSSDLNEYHIYNRADRLLEQEREETALALLKINTELKPGSSTAFHRLADLYLQMKNEELALRNYKKSLKFYPQNEEARNKIEELENPKAEI